MRLDDGCCAAGDTISGTVGGLTGGGSVALIRVERRPRHRRELTIAEVPATWPGDPFRLTVPDAALPSTAGEQCALAYVVRARDAGASACVDVVVVASARPRVARGSFPADRLLANWDARHFHIELSEAQLHGGGRVTGRIHRHGTWAPGTIIVTAQCLECWTSSSALPHGAPPPWHVVPLWKQAQPLPVDPDATWAPFGFELPDGLPRAVEAPTIAWRYELRAQRIVPHWFDETAALTPLLFPGAWPGG
ncbi:MAG: hypothetical protein E6G41_02975 [Actinobacteria bacterium]|nr:MAG: hypothetical protein E6G41_02975 [Actinomycetota bacterium]